ncbi:PREDICTED: putative defensin-like protein 169 [Camelina sativa]|uniref:Defensin-like protein 169 n=1 Tax=Camelina sativa TaxID=90675 RepID=A0ABM1QTR4_CAMSA|nr:PREDICTED: putative defensin-like protein 169 [Camelina sativa]
MNKSFSFTVLILIVVPVLVIGLVDGISERHPTEGWCKMPLPDQKAGRCNQDRCLDRCRSHPNFKFKGGKAMGTCTSSNTCFCTYRYR